MPDPISELQRLGQEFDADVVEAVAVTQADRDAANAFLRECPLSVKMVLGAKPSLIKNALARHRIAAIAAARPMIEKEAFEKAAKVAEHLRPAALSPQFYTPDIAAAIRALIEPRP